ncbi:DUF6443 domain-containing protein [uncultured Chitinophaga sp.]|uniref:DUF6443 domain-containing protein n=1 Tax=uncultured Chitinophaga sp. TaxID=339340 RepID=UPI002617DBD7|nr:DUF6443 domain-containing protein [uncultured Chitinophaga sp.]
MKKIHLSIIKSLVGLVLMIAIIPANAQTPNSSVRPAATPVSTSPAYTNTLVNYIRTWEPNMPTSDPATIAASDVNTARQSTQYFDGLGRPLQTVARGITPAGRDLVAPVIYDIYGREQFRYLPYVPTTGNLSDGKFKADPFNDQSRFYLSESLVPGAKGEAIYYDQTQYEASPLNRVLKTYAPGNSWAKNDPAGVQKGGNRPIEHQFLLNTAADAVRIWDMPATGNTPTSGSGSIYDVGQLYKNVTKDERGFRTVEFKDKADRVVLKKVEVTASAADGHDGWLCTYYVYDDQSNLRFVIPPKAVELIKTSWAISSSIASELCLQYQYDNRNRMIIKKIPGADPVEMVYDVRDRLVFTRDGNLKSKSQWLVTFYDGQNRHIMTALYNSSATRDALQISMNTAISGTQAITHSYSGVADLVVAAHDGRPIYQASNSITFEDGFDSNTAEMLAEINSAAVQETLSINATNPLPSMPASTLTPLIYTFYDDYNYTGKHDAVTGDFTQPQYTGSNYAEVVTAASNLTTGLMTGARVRVLGTDQWLTTTAYYTDKGRLLQTISDNISGSKDVLTSLYDFSGKLLSTYHRHNNLRSSAVPDVKIMTQVLYDAAGRVTDVIKQVNGGARQTIAKNTYDELGQLQSKRLHVNGSSQLEKLDYEYNVRGWLKSINKLYVNDVASNPTSNWFGQELSYDYGFTTNQYTGNIAGIKWRGRNDNIPRVYGYSYDNANRLTNADFNQKNNPSAGWTQDQKNFSVSNLTYDANGNIKTMTQKGMVGSTISIIDQLAYSYKEVNEASNKLRFVGDNGANTATAKLGDFINGANTGDDYDYDPNGNLTMDLNKNISSITYNHLNLPELITISGKGSIRYQYDAVGNKLKKTVTDNTTGTSKVTTTDYMGSMVYRNNQLELISHEEGRIRPVFNNGQLQEYVYDYFLKDHLGNVRTVLTTQTEFDMYAATMETERAATEAALFSNVEESRAAKPVGYPEDETNNKNKFVAKLNARDGGKKIGPSLVLRVMAGDTIQIGAKVFYKSTGPKDTKSVAPEDMIASLLQAFGGEKAGNASHAARQEEQLSPFRNFNWNDYQRLKEKDPNNQGAQNNPRAYLNFVLFDDQFNLVEENSGVRQVKAMPDELQTLAVDKMPLTKSGFLYVYTSNEITQDVFFDNITLGVAQGPLLEETHYYPFGLTMAGISSNALKGTNYPENRRKYNGIEHTTDFDLNQYDAFFRNLDPQIGRWWQVDPKSEYFEDVTPYNHVLNNPITMSDPYGDDTVHINDLPNVWPDFDPGKDVVNLTGIVVKPNGARSEIYDPGALPGFKVLPAVRGFWNRMLTGERRHDNGLYRGIVDYNGVLTNRGSPRAGMPNALVNAASTGGIGSIRTVYKGIKAGLPYIGKSINLLKRYTAAERAAMKIQSLFPGAEGRLLRAVEQVVLDYQKTLGPVSNINKAMDFNLAKNKGMYEKAIAFLEENFPNWKEMVATSH